MIYFLALIPATALTVAGYCALFLSNRSEGAFRSFGRYLGFWAFTLAALVVLGAIFAAAHGGHHHRWRGAHEMHERMDFRGPMGPRAWGPRPGDPRPDDPPRNAERPGEPAAVAPNPAPQGAAPTPVR